MFSENIAVRYIYRTDVLNCVILGCAFFSTGVVSELA